MLIEGRLELGSHIITIYSKNGNLFDVQHNGNITFDDSMPIIKKFVEVLNKGFVQYIIEAHDNGYICERFVNNYSKCAVLKTHGTTEIEALTNNIHTKEYLDKLI